ncbi:YkvA family protein [Heliobacterium mobile]|uniref:YkvA family protein n=1 Tax=Heliobacterium mobile TaxID=28064 RepID=UPI001A9B384C|nr:YkvA family protein [Heliobacterium mobile]
MLNLPRSGRLVYGLLRDGRVPLINKALFTGLGLLYLIWPLDVLPDMIPLIGELDDLTIILFLVDRFVASAPNYVVQEYLDRFQ